MSLREQERDALVDTLRHGSEVRRIAIENMDHERKIALFPAPFLANVGFGNPRFAARVAKRIMKRYDLPPAHTVDSVLGALIACTDEQLQVSMIRLGLLVILKQLPRLMKREDIETLNKVFGSEAVMFAMENRALAPAWPHFILRLPEHNVLREQVVRYGWMALIYWLENRYPEHSRWFFLRLPLDFAPLKDSFPVAAACVPAVEKALEDILANAYPDQDSYDDVPDDGDDEPRGIMQSAESEGAYV